jgi:hypothetical protein
VSDVAGKQSNKAQLGVEHSPLVVGCSSSSDSPAITEEQKPGMMMESVPDPLVQNRIQVDFGITVPAYQSDALQVRLVWGETDVTASWVGDELWSTTLELPTNTKHTLSVTFSDRNGDIVLASFEETYRTGINATEIFNIAAEQFNSEKWDTDKDGTSNFVELIAGTDPLVDEASLLPIVDDQQNRVGALMQWRLRVVSRPSFNL